jgi:pyridoxine kinase
MGENISQSLFTKLLEGIMQLDAERDIKYLITGYFAETELMEIASEYIRRIKSNTHCTYICDPVMGDYRAGGLYVKKEVADYYAQRLIALSDVITPNQFELEYLLKGKVTNVRQLTELIGESELLHSKTVIVTSAELEDTPEGELETIIVRAGHLVRVQTKKIDNEVIGTGDLFTALMTSFLIKKQSLEEAVKRTTDFLEQVIEYLKEQSVREMTSESIVRFASLLR